MRVRKARFAGSWYTNDPVVLRSEIDEFLELVQRDLWKPLSQQGHAPEGRRAAPVRAGMLPHAGLYFSGRGIAHLFHGISADTEEVIIIAPSHYAPLIPDTLFCSAHEAFDTPLGRIPGIDLPSRDIHNQLREHTYAVDMEHAVEMFLPFIARVNETSERPVSTGILLVSEISGREELNELTSQLAALIGEQRLASGKTVLIASSDFTHYGTRFAYTPFGTEDIPEIERKVEAQDREVAQYLCSYQFQQLEHLRLERDITICGFSPGLLVSSIMERIGAVGMVCDYYNSNHFTGPDAGFVSYCTILWR